MDIAGFKAMMTDGRGEIALDAFYSIGYSVLRHNNQGVQIDGFFISDCGVLFARDESAANVARLESLCEVVKTHAPTNVRQDDSTNYFYCVGGVQLQ
jgi:hypothetical protein